MAKDTLIEKIDIDKIGNPHLRRLIEIIKQGCRDGVDPLCLTPETAQISPQGKWHHHTDHTDYTDHTDTKPSHGDYCD